MTLRVKVKVTKGQIPVSEHCENSWLPKSVWESWIFSADGERHVVEWMNACEAIGAMLYGASKIWGVGASPNFWRIFQKRYETPLRLDLEYFSDVT